MFAKNNWIRFLGRVKNRHVSGCYREYADKLCLKKKHSFSTYLLPPISGFNGAIFSYLLPENVNRNVKNLSPLMVFFTRELKLICGCLNSREDAPIQDDCYFCLFYLRFQLKLSPFSKQDEKFSMLQKVLKQRVRFPLFYSNSEHAFLN